MTKLLTAQQIRKSDQYTIQNEPIGSVDLMERAASKCSHWILKNLPAAEKFDIFTGPGNNGGDGLAIARQLAGQGKQVRVLRLMISEKLSADAQINLDRLMALKDVTVIKVGNISELPKIEIGTYCIDAIFGSGLSRPVDGLAREVIAVINKSENYKVAIDVPSGLFSENNELKFPEAIIKANHTLTFQLPKFSFFFGKNEIYVGKFKVLDIGLDNEFMESCDSDFRLVKNGFVKKLLRPDLTFSHKGNKGHALLIAGSYGKMGAAVLASRSCLKAGCGLLTVHIPKQGVDVLQSSVPEAMVDPDTNELFFTDLPDFSKYDAIGIGPGLGMSDLTTAAVKRLLAKCEKPLVIDADGLNIISADKQFLKILPKNTILTPHPKEFERMTGKRIEDKNDLVFLSDFARETGCAVIYKEAFTKMALPDGRVFINSTGNPGMATAGSGDTLTGMIVSLLAQGHSSEEAAIIGVYIHGLAGDLYVKKNDELSLVATDIIKHIGKAFKKTRKL